MPKEGDVLLTNLTALTSDGTGLSGAYLEIVVHNVGEEDIPEDGLTIAFFAHPGSGQTQGSTSLSFYTSAIAANEIHSPSGPMQLDPGDWTISATVFDSDSNLPLAYHDAIPVHVPGQVRHAQAFDNTVQYDLGVEIERIEEIRPNVYRVHYLLANNGATTVPPGMLVRGMIVENDDVLAWQDYHFEIACPPGPPDPKYLTLEGGSDGFKDAMVYVIADPSGPSETTDLVQATQAADGKVHFTR